MAGVGSSCLCALVSLGVALALCACAPKPEPTFFPNAVRVRILGSPSADSVEVDRAGRVTAAPGDPRVPHPAVIDGGDLTAKEVRRLRAAVHFTKPPPAEDAVACCSPRHTFLFYDARGRFLGHFTVCFECGCTDLEGAQPPRVDRYWIDWDAKALATIATAHHLTPLAHFGTFAPGARRWDQNRSRLPSHAWATRGAAAAGHLAVRD